MMLKATSLLLASAIILSANSPRTDQEAQWKALRSETERASSKLNPAIREQVKNPGAYIVGRVVATNMVLIHPSSKVFSIIPSHWIIVPPSDPAAADRFSKGWDNIKADFRQVDIISFVSIPDCTKYYRVVRGPIPAPQVDREKATATTKHQGLIVINQNSKINL